MNIKDSVSDKIFYILVNLLGIFFLIIVLYPLIYVVSASFSSGPALTQGRVWLWPVEFNVDGYKAIFANKMILTGYKNSLIYMVLGTSINLIMTVLAAYPLSRKELYGRGIFMFMFMFTMMFGGGLIPSYLLVRDLGMLNTIWALLIPGALSVWNVTITMNYFRTAIPNELIEAARIDGCSEFRVLGTIILPLSKTILAVMALFYAVGHWNSYFSALIYLNKRELYPLQIFLREVLVQNSMDAMATTNLDVTEVMAKENLQQLLKYALIVVASLPMMLIYPFIQKYFVKGVMIGSVKG